MDASNPAKFTMPSPGLSARKASPLGILGLVLFGVFGFLILGLLVIFGFIMSIFTDSGGESDIKKVDQFTIIQLVLHDYFGAKQGYPRATWDGIPLTYSDVDRLDEAWSSDLHSSEDTQRSGYSPSFIEKIEKIFMTPLVSGEPAPYRYMTPGCNESVCSTYEIHFELSGDVRKCTDGCAVIKAGPKVVGPDTYYSY